MGIICSQCYSYFLGEKRTELEVNVSPSIRNKPSSLVDDNIKDKERPKQQEKFRPCTHTQSTNHQTWKLRSDMLRSSRSASLSLPVGPKHGTTISYPQQYQPSVPVLPIHDRQQPHGKGFKVHQQRYDSVSKQLEAVEEVHRQSFSHERLFRSCEPSEVEESSKQTVVEKYFYQNPGLPNIGNTCFLNSVLQLLFSAKILRRAVIDQAKTHPRKETLRLLKHVFLDMQGDMKRGKKATHLHDLMLHIQAKASSLRYGAQQDALECYLTLFNLIVRESPHLNDLFEVEIKEKCQKCADGEISTLSNFLYQPKACADCQRPKQYQLQTHPKYLVILQEGTSPKMDLKTRGGDYKQRYYKLKSVVVYVGDKRTGHYYAYRKNNQSKWVLVNDISVEFVDLYSLLGRGREVPILSLYSRVEGRQPGE